MIKTNYRIFHLLHTAIFLYVSACNGIKDINVPLPEYENKLVVECYIEPGKPYRLLLTESLSYFDDPAVPDVRDALVTITSGGITDTLFYSEDYQDPLSGKFYNYINLNKSAPFTYGTSYSLFIKDNKGRTITGSTTLLYPVMINSIEFENNENDRRAVLISFNEDQNTENFYRFLIFQNTGMTQRDAVFSDRLFNSSQATIASGNQFGEGDIIFIWLYHIDKSYYEFLKSLEDARGANGNPFAQPSAIKSNVSGGIGIFTGLSYDFRELSVP